MNSLYTQNYEPINQNSRTPYYCLTNCLSDVTKNEGLEGRWERKPLKKRWIIEVIDN